MPGFYKDGEYDLAGFIVGVVDKRQVIDGKSNRGGRRCSRLAVERFADERLFAGAKLFFEIGGFTVDSHIDELGETVGEALLKPHASFLKPLDKLLESGKIKGLAHITGGGLLENIPRILPANVSVEIRRGTWAELPVFNLMQTLGNVETNEMFRAFNMGIGMVVVCTEADKEFLKTNLGECFEIGRVTDGNKEVLIA
jgi:phosphoribosylformylglycinamidine cyclo-ligase